MLILQLLSNKKSKRYMEHLGSRIYSRQNVRLKYGIGARPIRIVEDVISIPSLICNTEYVGKHVTLLEHFIHTPSPY